MMNPETKKFVMDFARLPRTEREMVLEFMAAIHEAMPSETAPEPKKVGRPKGVRNNRAPKAPASPATAPGSSPSAQTA